MKSRLAFLFIALLTIVQGAWAQEPIQYIDRTWDDYHVCVKEEVKYVENYVDVSTLPAGVTALPDGFCVVRGNVYRANGLRAGYNSHLILCDGASLTVPWIEVESDDREKNPRHLTIYGQSNDSGMLKCTGGDDHAGIGSYNYDWERGVIDGQSCDFITIKGGYIEATGDDDYPGIGGGTLYHHIRGEVKIYGGTVIARGGKKGAGIGSGENTNEIRYHDPVDDPGADHGSPWAKGNYGKIDIYGGHVMAYGGSDAAGIGGGYVVRGDPNDFKSFELGSVTIRGGVVEAWGGAEAAGIGSGQEGGSHGRSGAAGNIRIEGGTVTARAGIHGAGIGGGDGVNCDVVTITGGAVKAYAGADGAGIGGGEDGSGGDITISGGIVFAYGNTQSDGFGAGIGGGQDGNSGKITISGGEVHAYGGDDAAGIGTGEETTSGPNIWADNITISGGAVEAVGGGNGAGIGAGEDAEVGTITITSESGSVYVSGRAGNDCGWWAGAFGAYKSDYFGTLNIGKGVKVLSIETDYTWSTIPVAWNPVAFAQQRCHVQLRTCDHPGATVEDCGDGQHTVSNCQFCRTDKQPHHFNDDGSCVCGLNIHFKGSGTQEDPYTIASTEEWNNMQYLINQGFAFEGKYIRLVSDISVTTLATPLVKYCFKGHFDGDSHTITANIDSQDDYVALFPKTLSATIRNLRVDGKFSVGNYGAAVIGQSDRLVMQNVLVTADVQMHDYTTAGSGVHVGGVIANITGESNITGVVNTGNISISNVTMKNPSPYSFVSPYSDFCVGGIAGFSQEIGLITIDDCLFAGTYQGNAAFAPLVYTDWEGYGYKRWPTGGYIPDDESWHYFPYVGNRVFFTDKSANPKKLQTVFMRGVMADVSTTPAFGNVVKDYGFVKALDEGLYFDGRYYGFNPLAKGKGTAEDPYVVANDNDWEDFCSAINDHFVTFHKQHVRLDGDIHITRMAGDHNWHAFSGTFDGNGHTIDVELPNMTDVYCAPFRFVYNGTVEHLKVTGLISSSAENVGGVAAHADGLSTFRNICSAVTIRDLKTGTGWNNGHQAAFGGIVGRIPAAYTGEHVVLDACVFVGAMEGTGYSSYCSALVGMPEEIDEEDYGFYTSHFDLFNCFVNPAKATGLNGDSYYFYRAAADFGKFENNYAAVHEDKDRNFDDYVLEEEKIVFDHGTAMPEGLGDVVAKFDYVTFYENGIYCEGRYFTEEKCPDVAISPDDDYNALYEQYAGQVVNARLTGRTYQAKQKADGTWQAYAYSVCLPFDMNLEPKADIDEVVEENVEVYKLQYIKDNSDFVFSRKAPYLFAGEPYLIVVRKGSIELKASEVELISKNTEGTEVINWANHEDPAIGRWRGTLQKIEHSDAAKQNAYIMQKDGTFKRIKATDNAWVGAFVSAFYPNQLTGCDSYKIKLGEVYPGGGPEEDYVTDFPDAVFDTDCDINDATGITTTDCMDSTDKADAWYTIDGRKLQGKPTQKGIYIHQGEKVVIEK